MATPQDSDLAANATLNVAAFGSHNPDDDTNLNTVSPNTTVVAPPADVTPNSPALTAKMMQRMGPGEHARVSPGNGAITLPPSPSMNNSFGNSLRGRELVPPFLMQHPSAAAGVGYGAIHADANSSFGDKTTTASISNRSPQINNVRSPGESSRRSDTRSADHSSSNATTVGGFDLQNPLGFSGSDFELGNPSFPVISPTAGMPAGITSRLDDSVTSSVGGYGDPAIAYATSISDGSRSASRVSPSVVQDSPVTSAISTKPSL